VGQQELFYETLTDALRATVDALGGPKTVGPILYPEKTIDEARRMLLDCINPERPHRLDPDKLILVLSLARQKGVHTAIAWILDACGYAPPQPVEPADLDAELLRQELATLDRLEALMKRRERLRGKG
jgi:hypothetical protein